VRYRRVLDDKYEILGTIGNGRFAKYTSSIKLFAKYRVKKAVELSSGREVAIKLMKLTDEDFETRKEML
jgi:hypothetical protein